MQKVIAGFAGAVIGVLGAVWASTSPATVALEAQGGHDPCALAKQFVVVRQTGNTQLLAGTNNSTMFICSVMLVTASTQNVALVEGTGTVCGTGPSGIMGGNTAALGLNLVANEGLAFGNGSGSLTKTYTPGGNLCLLQSGSGQISGVIGLVVP